MNNKILSITFALLVTVVSMPAAEQEEASLATLKVSSSAIKLITANYEQHTITLHANDKDFILMPSSSPAGYDAALYYKISELLRATEIEIEYIVLGSAKEPNIDPNTKKIYISGMTFFYGK